ncbi:SDR family NAD(P)-dependent oxidoreductase [Pantoea sp. B65]|uniref:SDR family NAD(P)-dependent oxidoreductase n=1 Tax=Pantoea sp. B65 TaxID=2813359 RepID=UPI0039B69DA4
MFRFPSGPLLERDWKVIATMRTPSKALLPDSAHLQLLPLDVTDPASIRQAVAAAGPIDVLVNNAGIGALGAVEGMRMETVHDIFATNTLGTIAMTQAVLPQFRQRQAGIIVNVTSSVTLAPLSLLAVYTASKAAVNAFSESLALELQQFNIRVKLVLPGRAPETRFGENAQPRMQDAIPEAYAALAQRVFSEWAQSSAITTASDVAEAVWRAVNEPESPLRIAAGADAVALAELY